MISAKLDDDRGLTARKVLATQPDQIGMGRYAPSTVWSPSTAVSQMLARSLPEQWHDQ